ncbi:MAG: hypothetical protein H0V09_07135, partial [Gemmatimonadetes bacterium]|nr:hypothetical protein [Gemmatimonadota bacterium]
MACSDESTPLASDPQEVGELAGKLPPCPIPRALIDAFPARRLRQAFTSQCSNIVRQRDSGRLEDAALKASDLIEFVLTHAGRLRGG